MRFRFNPFTAKFDIDDDTGATSAILLNGSNTGTPVLGEFPYFDGSTYTKFARPSAIGTYVLVNNSSGGLMWVLQTSVVSQNWNAILTTGRTSSGVNPQLTTTDHLEFRGSGKYISSLASGSLDIISDGSLNINPSTLGFFGVSAVARQTLGSTLTNNVTSGGTSHTIADFNNIQDLAASGTDTVARTDVPSKNTVDATFATVRNDIYQLSTDLKTVMDALRNYGLLT